MSFYKELSPFIDYIHSIRKLESYLSFDMKFPEKWSMPKNIIDDGQVVGFESDEPNKRGISFVTEVNEKQISKTLVLIGKIIKLNKERELKEQLFKQTVDQLKKTFEKNDLDKLQNLHVGPRGVLDIPIVFTPNELRRYDVRLIVSARREASMSWIEQDPKYDF
jgi:hypothetical protein